MDNENITFLNVDDLLFDPENPRLPYYNHSEEDEIRVIEWMLRNGNIIELMGSIGQTGYFPGEPVLVIESKDRAGHYVVVEGNRRLTAVKLLLRPALATIKKKAVAQTSQEAKHKPEEIPAIVYPSRKDILNYLGYRHITGIKEWNPLQKARYLSQLIETLDEKGLNEKFKTLARTIGSNSSYVARLLTGLSLYHVIEDHSFFDIKGLDEDEIDFSILTTAISHSNIVDFLGIESNKDPSLDGLDNTRLKEFTSWLFEEFGEGKTRLGESRNLGDLATVVANEKALDEFRKGTPLHEAILYTDEPERIFQNSIRDSKSSLQNARNYIHLIDNFSEEELNIVQEIIKLARFLVSGIKGKLEEEYDIE